MIRYLFDRKGVMHEAGYVYSVWYRFLFDVNTCSLLIIWDALLANARVICPYEELLYLDSVYY